MEMRTQVIKMVEEMEILIMETKMAILMEIKMMEIIMVL